jgi:hypothetical protein
MMVDKILKDFKTYDNTNTTNSTTSNSTSSNSTTNSTKEVANEIPSVKDYYDGAPKLNGMNFQCKMYSKMLDCVHQSNCGWCGASAHCVRGNQAGPLEACLQTTYVFTSGSIHTPPERIAFENMGGLSIAVRSGTDMYPTPIIKNNQPLK